MNTSRKKNGRFAGKDKVTAFLGLLAIFGMAGYAAWYHLNGGERTVPFVSVTEAATTTLDYVPNADGTVTVRLEGNRWVTATPELLAKNQDIPWMKASSTEPEERPYMGHLGYDITRYATDPQHEEKVAKILDKMPGIRTAAEAEKYIRSNFPKSPVTGYMVFDAGKKYDVPLPLILGIMQADSSMGTAGLGAKTRNPGNVMNNDAGNVHYYPTWSEGVEGVARWLSKHKI